AHQPSYGGRQAQNQGSPPHAPARLRLPPGKRRTGYAIAAGVPRTQEHPAHSTLHRAGPDTIQRMVEGLNDEKATSNQYRCAVPRALRVTGYGSILGSRWSIYRGISWPRILPRIRNASVYLVNFSGLRRLARSWWGTCARSPCWTKKRAV